MYVLINNSENSGSQDLNEKGQNICVLYKIFYREHPDFREEETQTKIQAMFYILNYFDLDTFYDFDIIANETNLPFSTKLEKDILNLIPFSKIVVKAGQRKISEFTKRKIEIIGEMVRKETQNKIENLINFISSLMSEEKQTPDLETIAKSRGIELEDIIENLNK